MVHLMNESEIIACVCALHDPAALQEAMVYEVWEDGEITLTKGGAIYGQRTLHLMASGDKWMALPWDSLPLKNTKHSRIAVKTHQIAMTARALIFGDALTAM